jgi:hypothetical protein
MAGKDTSGSATGVDDICTVLPFCSVSSAIPQWEGSDNSGVRPCCPGGGGQGHAFGPQTPGYRDDRHRHGGADPCHGDPRCGRRCALPALCPGMQTARRHSRRLRRRTWATACRCFRGSFGDMRRRRRGHSPDPDAARRARIPDRAAGAGGKGDPPWKNRWAGTLRRPRRSSRSARAAGVPLGVVFQHRMREASQAALALVRGGTLGALGLAEISVPWWREQAYYDEPGRGTYARDGGGVLISQAIHTIDLALTLTGPVASVQAMTGTSRLHDMEAEDMAVSGLRFANGGLGWLTASTASFPGRSESITLHFEKASLHLAEGVLQVHWRDGRPRHMGRRRPPAAARTRWPSPMTGTSRCWRISRLPWRRVVRLRSPGRDAPFAAHELIDAITHPRTRGENSYTRIWKADEPTFRCPGHRPPTCLRHDRAPDRRGRVLRRMVDRGQPRNGAAVS